MTISANHADHKMHASAPTGLRCSDCTMDGEACPLCYAVWWKHRHPHTTQLPEIAPISGEGTGTLTPEWARIHATHEDVEVYRVEAVRELQAQATRLGELLNARCNEVAQKNSELADVDATLAAKSERIAELEAFQDAFDAGQEASLKGEPRESNPHPPGDSYGVDTLWLQWDDGYDCNINRKLKAELLAKDAQLAELPDIEVVSAAVHEAWMDTKRAQGITSRPSADGVEQMVPYADLPDALQELDRSTVRAVYAAIQKSAGEPGAK